MTHFLIESNLLSNILSTYLERVQIKEKKSINSIEFFRLQCESGFIESPLSEINFLISLAWAKGAIDVGDPML